MPKFITAREAADLIPDGATVATRGFMSYQYAEEISVHIEKRFLETGHPNGLTFFASAGSNLANHDYAWEHFAHAGMTKRCIYGHVGNARKMSALIYGNEIEGYTIPQGSAVHFTAAMARGTGYYTKVGLKTMCDPRIEGGRVNASSTMDISRIIEIDGEEYLYYKPFPINVALLKVTSADQDGNCSIEKEAVFTEQLELAMACRRSGGIVIVEACQIVERHTIHPKQVVIPGALVDYIVKESPEYKTFSVLFKGFDLAYCGDIRVPTDAIPRLPWNWRKVIAKRCAMELRPNQIVNLGFGVPDLIGAVANEENIKDNLSFTMEVGAFGGVPTSNLEFGAAINPAATIGQQAMFNFYDGGGLDIAFLGLAEADRFGNVNASKFGGRAVGPGGFIDISQCSKKIVFAGSFLHGKPEYEIGGGKLTIKKDGDKVKFLNNVEQITFSGEYAREIGQPALYITERAVFEMRKEEGLTLIEIAPGVNLEADILAKMEFRPSIAKELKTMDAALFDDKEMNLKCRFFS